MRQDSVPMPHPFPIHRLGPCQSDGRPFRLGIVIPLQSQSTARCWEQVEGRLRVTTGTLCQQTSNAWEAVIVGQDRPSLDALGLANLSFLKFDQPPPPAGTGGLTGMWARRRDGQAKKVAGLRFLAARRTITHWFFLDADDLLHEEFIATLSRMIPFDLAVVRHGHAYYPTQQRYRHINRIDQICGSTVILSDRWWSDPASPEGRRYGVIDHRHTREYAALRGVPLHDYPGRGVAYVLGHGDNLYRTVGRRLRVWFGSRLLARPCDPEFLRAFACEPCSSGPHLHCQDMER